jgi:tetratricopeptide (TPR) repeat protein
MTAQQQALNVSKHIMKTSILIALFLFSTLPTFCQSNFEKGFERGYEKGYCLNAGVGCLAPLPPLAPLPRIGEDFNSYQDGYNRGFETGLNANSGNSKERQRYKTSSTEPIEYMQRSNLNDIVALAKILKEAKNKAFELQNEGAYQASINISLAGLKIIPRDDEFLTLAGYSYVQLRNYSEGLKYLKKAHKINRDPNLQELIGKIENGSYQKELQDEKPSGVENTERRNVNLTDDIKENMRNKNYNKALELSNQLVAQEKTWQAFALRGYIQYVLKNFSACITDYTKSISINPNSDSYFMRALSKVEMENFLWCTK